MGGFSSLLQSNWEFSEKTMVYRSAVSGHDQPVRINLSAHAPQIEFRRINVGTDNIHFDVFLSSRFLEFTRSYLLDLIRQVTQLTQFSGADSRPFKNPETSTFKKMLAEMFQASLSRAKNERNIELDLLLRVSLLKCLTQEISSQFAYLVLEGKEWIRNRGVHFERSENAHVMRARLAELQADRRNVYRQVGQQVFQSLKEVEETIVCKARRALFGEECATQYELMMNRLLFVEGGKDDVLFLDNYVLLGNYLRDQDRFETVDAFFLDFLRECVVAGGHRAGVSEASRDRDKLINDALAVRDDLARLEEERESLLRKMQSGSGLLSGKFWRDNSNGMQQRCADLDRRITESQRKLESIGADLEAAKCKADFLADDYQSSLGDYLNAPDNARRLFDPQCGGDGLQASEPVSRLLSVWVRRLREKDLLVHILASYELRNIYRDYCPPVHLQQLKKALVYPEELGRVEEILKQFPARRFSMKRMEDMARKIRRYPEEEARTLARRFAEEFMRLRRDLKNYQHLVAQMERINLIRSERARDLSRLNNSLYEFLLPDEARPAEDRVVAHAVIKADVRGSTLITQELLDRGLNPASHFSLNLYEPVKRILERYGAAKVFIEGDAIVLAIFENESNRKARRAVATACILAREILAVSQAYNSRAEKGSLPRLELGLGIAFQNSAPTIWMDSDSRIMISRALNLSDRLSGCSKVARRLLGQHSSLFNLFLFQPAMAGTVAEEMEELVIRYNMNGIELSEEGFQKLCEEISLTSVECALGLPWGKERVTLYFGETPIGDLIEPIVIRKGMARQLQANGKIGPPTSHAYYEVCANPKILELAQSHAVSLVHKN